MSRSEYEVTWTAQEVGTHMVNIEYASQIVGNSPYPVKAYDPTKVKVSDIENGFVGKPVAFTGITWEQSSFSVCINVYYISILIRPSLHQWMLRPPGKATWR